MVWSNDKESPPETFDIQRVALSFRAMDMEQVQAREARSSAQSWWWVEVKTSLQNSGCSLRSPWAIAFVGTMSSSSFPRPGWADAMTLPWQLEEDRRIIWPAEEGIYSWYRLIIRHVIAPRHPYLSTTNRYSTPGLNYSQSRSAELSSDQCFIINLSSYQ